MKTMTKLIALMMTTIMLFSFVACGLSDGTGDGVDDSTCVDTVLSPSERVNYSSSDKQFKFFAYSSLSNGKTRINSTSEIDVGESFITKERIQEYYDSGMGYLLPQSKAVANSASQPDFTATQLYQVLNWAEELGKYKSVLVTDNQIYLPYNKAKAESAYANLTADDWQEITCIGTDYEWQFASEAELDAHMKTQLLRYCYHPAFAGVFLPDEPRAKWLNVIGEMYRSLRRVQQDLGIAEEDFFINSNLLPCPPRSQKESNWPSISTSYSEDKLDRLRAAYKIYLERFMQATGSKYITVDTYPLNYSDGEYGIYYNLLANLQIMAEVAKEYDAKIIIITQCCSYGTVRVVNQDDLYFLTNLIMSFGAANIGYFTYYTHEFDGTNVFNENGSMVNSFGDKTPVYYYVKQVNTRAQKLAPTILNFDYTASKVYAHKDCKDAYVQDGLKQQEFLNIAEFQKLKSVEINKESAVVTELYDNERDNYMYAVTNTCDPRKKGATYYQTATLTFDSEYNRVYVYFNGEYKVYELSENNTLTLKMRPGEAHYIIPYAE